MKSYGARLILIVCWLGFSLACSVFGLASPEKDSGATEQVVQLNASLTAMQQEVLSTLSALQAIQTQVSAPTVVPNTPLPSPTVDLNPAYTQTAAARESAVASEGTVTQQVMQATSSALSSLVGGQFNFTPVYGPENGDLAHNPTDTKIHWIQAEVSLVDFIAKAQFLNPYGSKSGKWSYGYIFRNVGPNQQYRLIVRSNRKWELAVTRKLTLEGYANSRTVKSGTIDNLDINEGGANILILTAYQDQGKFFCNGSLVAAFKLGELMEPGGIGAATGFAINEEISGKVTGIREFTVWSIQP